MVAAMASSWASDGPRTPRLFDRKSSSATLDFQTLPSLACHPRAVPLVVHQRLELLMVIPTAMVLRLERQACKTKINGCKSSDKPHVGHECLRTCRSWTT